jgi:hypothetical protein
MVKIQVSFSDVMGQVIKERADMTGQSMSSVVAFYVTEYLEAKQGIETFKNLVEVYNKEQDKLSKSVNIKGVETGERNPND